MHARDDDEEEAYVASYVLLLRLRGARTEEWRPGEIGGPRARISTRRGDKTRRSLATFWGARRQITSRSIRSRSSIDRSMGSERPDGTGPGAPVSWAPGLSARSTPCGAACGRVARESRAHWGRNRSIHQWIKWAVGSGTTRQIRALADKHKEPIPYVVVSPAASGRAE